jgi:hypothetical protein
VTVQPISPLVANLITASLAASHATTDTLIDGLTEQRDKAEATVDAIRARVGELLDGPYAPSASAIERALWPSPEVVDRFRRAGEQS